MQTTLAPKYQGTTDGTEAEAILRKCVHCGFCTATCPTYQLLGDELDADGILQVRARDLETSRETGAQMRLIGIDAQHGAPGATPAIM